MIEYRLGTFPSLFFICSNINKEDGLTCSSVGTLISIILLILEFTNNHDADNDQCDASQSPDIHTMLFSHQHIEMIQQHSNDHLSCYDQTKCEGHANSGYRQHGAGDKYRSSDATSQP